MNLPDSSNHLAIVGTNGSGKTQAALWHLSLHDIDRRPWVVYNFKSDKSIDGIPQAVPIELNELPVQPGVYITHPMPETDDDKVEAQLWSIWERENIGVYVDEGYMIGRNNPAFRALLTQGRSRNNGMIVLTQRPVWLDPFILSEANFYQVFRLNHARDRKTVEEFVPFKSKKVTMEGMPRYHSVYYDVGEDELTKLAPVPSIDVIHSTFARRLERVRKTG